MISHTLYYYWIKSNCFYSFHIQYFVQKHKVVSHEHSQKSISPLLKYLSNKIVPGKIGVKKISTSTLHKIKSCDQSPCLTSIFEIY